MLRVGLTGGLGSGKSTVAAMFARGGVHVLEADGIGREMMQPGQPVYAEVLAHFRNAPGAPALTQPDGTLDRAALAKYVFSSGRLEELSRIVHPAVVAEQERRMAEMFRSDPAAIAMVESALIFEADRAGTAPGLSRRFDKLILVSAPEPIRIARYVSRMAHGRTLTEQERTALEEDARSRIARQIRDEEKAPHCDFILENAGPLEAVETRVQQVLQQLRQFAADPERSSRAPASTVPATGGSQ